MGRKTIVVPFVLLCAGVAFVSARAQDAVKTADQKGQTAGASNRQREGGSPEMEKLFRIFQGKWTYHLERANGQNDEGEEIWRSGPGGLALIEDEYVHGSGTVGLSVTWWDAVARGYRAIWCDNTLPTGCIMMSKLAHWEGREFVLRDESERNGKKFDYKEVVSDITPTSYTQTIYEGEHGGEMKRVLTIHAVKASTSEAASLTGKMAIYNSLLGDSWTCTADVPAMSGQPAHTETDKVSFAIAPQNVLLIEVSSSQFAARSFIGFDSKSDQYWRTEMGVFGGIMRETSTDGLNFSGKSTMNGETWEPVRSVVTAVQPDGSSSDTEWWTRNGTELKITSHCTR